MSDIPILEVEEFYRGDDVHRRCEMIRAWRTIVLADRRRLLKKLGADNSLLDLLQLAHNTRTSP